MPVSFHKNGTIDQFQIVVNKIYGLPDDRLYSIWDLLAQQQRFTMRALKGVRKDNQDKIRTNLLIAFSWTAAIANRLHVNMDNELWNRFPGVCSYCAKQPCACNAIKPSARKKVLKASRSKPVRLSDFQNMFEQIYPSSKRTIDEAAVHLAEEIGEVSEAIHNYLGQHTEKTFEEIPLEIADFVSCVFGLANSAKVNMAAELAGSFYNNCHICHKLPCVCTFSKVARIES